VQSGTATPVRRRRKIRSEGVPAYLTKIVGSGLCWIQDEEQKEQVWELAARRLAERSGRTGMGALSRTFTIPLRANDEDETVQGKDGEEQDEEDELHIILHEPALTADNLGLKTWASSYLLAKRLVILKDSLPSLRPDDAILELGAGTGLVGIAAAAIIGRKVILTDLPSIVSNLERNVRANVAALAGAEVETAVLDWSEPAAFALQSDIPQLYPLHSFSLILAADPIYSSDHPALLVNAIAQHLSRDERARVVVEMPVREAFGAEREDFRRKMTALGLVVLKEGEEVGLDDWGQAGGNEGDVLDGEHQEAGEEATGAEVRCWWSVWGWR
jgi:predicted nicotinamide N-methyase